MKNYVFWVKETSENDSEINTMLGELGKEIQIPDPDSQTFNEQYASWEETWQNRINCLENLIQELPQFFESQKKELKNTVINTELLSEYNANEQHHLSHSSLSAFCTALFYVIIIRFLQLLSQLLKEYLGNRLEAFLCVTEFKCFLHFYFSNS